MDAFAMNAEDGTRRDSTVFHRNDGYFYHFNKVHYYGEDRENCAKTVYVRCRYHDTYGCRGTARIHFTALEEHMHWINGQAHDCTEDVQHIAEIRITNQLKEESTRHPWEPLQDVWHRVTEGYDPVTAALVPYNTVRESMRTARMAIFPPLPAAFEDLQPIFEDRANGICTTADGNDFIYHGAAGPVHRKSYIFLSRRMSRFLRRSYVILSDETFGITPQSPKSSQVLQICTIDHNHCVIPLVQILMQRRTYGAYIHALMYIRQHFPGFRPLLVVCDFERAQQRAWRDVFLCAVMGCYFHFTRAVSIHARVLGLSSILPPNFAPVASIVRCTCALALLPPDLILRGFFSLIREAITKQVLLYLEDFFMYVFDTWIASWRMETLSVYRAKWRTNNGCESAQRMLQRCMGMHHPALWKFIDGLRKYERRNFVKATSLQMGIRTVRRRKASAVNNDINIRNLTASLLRGHISINRFLHRASMRIVQVFVLNFN